MNNKMMVIREMHAYIILLPACEPAHVHVRITLHYLQQCGLGRNEQKVLQTTVVHDSSVARLRSPSGGRQKHWEAKHDSFTAIRHMLQTSKREQFSTSPVRT